MKPVTYISCIVWCTSSMVAAARMIKKYYVRYHQYFPFLLFFFWPLLINKMLYFRLIKNIFFGFNVENVIVLPFFILLVLLFFFLFALFLLLVFPLIKIMRNIQLPFNKNHAQHSIIDWKTFMHNFSKNKKKLSIIDWKSLNHRNRQKNSASHLSYMWR